MTPSIKLITASLALATITLTGCSSTAPPGQPAAATTTAAASPMPATQWKAGVYKVGDDIQAGSYKTPGDTSQCYWNRLKDASGESAAIIARDIFSGPGRMVVETTDAYIKFGGACLWTRT